MRLLIIGAIMYSKEKTENIKRAIAFRGPEPNMLLELIKAKTININKIK